MKKDPETIISLHSLFKREQVRKYSVEVVRCALRRGEVWPDDVDPAVLEKEDRNCIGTVFRMLGRAGVLKRDMGQFRRSRIKQRNGGIIWRYRLESASKAEALLNNLAGIPRRQMELI